MEYRIDKNGLMDRLSVWDGFLKKKVILIACGGTALTLLGVKVSTKDIDLIVPNEDEYKYLIGTLKDMGYEQASGYGWTRNDGFIFDIYCGRRVHTTELLDSPADNNIRVKEFSRIYLGVLNYPDILISKLFRGTSVDFEDCLALVRAKAAEVDIPGFVSRFKEAASYDVSEDRINGHLESFLKLLKKEGFKW
jgi:hypothetical protein